MELLDGCAFHTYCFKERVLILAGGGNYCLTQTGTVNLVRGLEAFSPLGLTHIHVSALVAKSPQTQSEFD